MKYDVVFSNPPFGRRHDWKDFHTVNMKMAKKHVAAILPVLKTSSSIVKKWEVSAYYDDVPQLKRKTYCYIIEK